MDTSKYRHKAPSSCSSEWQGARARADAPSVGFPRSSPVCECVFENAAGGPEQPPLSRHTDSQLFGTTTQQQSILL